MNVRSPKSGPALLLVVNGPLCAINGHITQEHTSYLQTKQRHSQKDEIFFARKLGLIRGTQADFLTQSALQFADIPHTSVEKKLRQHVHSIGMLHYDWQGLYRVTI